MQVRIELMTASVAHLPLSQIIKHERLLSKSFDNVDARVVDGDLGVMWVITGEVRGNEVVDEQV